MAFPKNLPADASTTGMVVSDQPGNSQGGIANVVAGTKDAVSGTQGNKKGIDLVSIAQKLAQKNHINKGKKGKK